MRKNLILVLLIFLGACIKGESEKKDFLKFLEEKEGNYLELNGFFTDFNPYKAERCNGIKYFFYVNCSSLGFVCGKGKHKSEAYLPVIGNFQPELKKSLWIRGKITKRNITCVDYYIERSFPFLRKSRVIKFEDFVLEIDEKYCNRDEDCACGTHISSGECFFGNKMFVNTSERCPDFCSGIAGNFKLSCINKTCKLHAE